MPREMQCADDGCGLSRLRLLVHVSFPRVTTVPLIQSLGLGAWFPLGSKGLAGGVLGLAALILCQQGVLFMDTLLVTLRWMLHPCHITHCTVRPRQACACVIHSCLLGKCLGFRALQVPVQKGAVECCITPVLYA